jgi:hypothetical protein
MFGLPGAVPNQKKTISGPNTVICLTLDIFLLFVTMYLLVMEMSKDEYANRGLPQ